MTISFPEILIYLAGFSIIAVASNQLSRIFLRTGLPLITGLLVIGILAGPYVLDLVPAEAVDDLDFVNDIALTFISFSVGAELYLRELRNRLRSITLMTVSQLILTFVLGSLAVYLLADRIPFMHRLDAPAKLAVSLLAGTIFVARSPASTLAIVHEMRAKGPFTQTALGVTVLIDFLVVILFTVTITIAETLVQDTGFKLLNFGVLLLDLVLAFVLGFLLSKLLNVIISIKIISFVRTALIFLSGYGIFILSHAIRTWSLRFIHADVYSEPLLICIIASFILTNYSKHRIEFLKILKDSRTVVYVVFFTLIGASISLKILVTVWVVAISLFIIRMVILFIAGYAGGLLAGDPNRFNRIAWMPYVTQAGVSLGLTTVVAGAFHGWGKELETALIGIIVISQVFGPPLFKWALNHIGEGHVPATPPEPGSIRTALVFGLESQSLALARQLREHEWNVKIATMKADAGKTDIPGVEIHRIDGLTQETMEKMGAAGTDAIVTMLSDEENFRICEMAFERFGTKDLVVRLHDRKNLERFHSLGALIVEPATAMVSLLDHFVRSPQATSLLLGMEENQDTVMLEVRNPNLYGMALRNLRLPHDIIVLSVSRSGHNIISHGYTRLRKHDVVTLVGSSESLENVRLRFEG